MNVNVFCWTVVSFSLAVSMTPSSQAQTVPTIKTRKSSIFKKQGNDALRMPSDVAVGSGGRLYVVDGVRHRIVVFDTQGSVQFTFGGMGKTPGKLLYPLGITSGPNGTIYVADTGNHRIQKFSADGGFLSTITVQVEDTEKEPDMTDVAIDPGLNRLYIADNDNHRILIYDLETYSFLKPWGKPGKARLMFRYPYLMAVAPEGYLLVVETINTRVQVINSRGLFVSFIGTWGVQPGQIFRPKGVAVHEERIFVSDGYLGRVQVYTLRGKFLGVLGDSDGKPLEFNTPTGMAVDPRLQRIYIVEMQANQIRCIDL